MPRTMIDSTTPRSIPHDAQMVAGYVDGSFKTYPQLVQMFPHAIKVSIAVTSHTDAQVIDREPGNIPINLCPSWVKRQRDQGRDPTLYCMWAEWNAVKAEFHKQGVAEPHYWIALYDNIPDLTYGIVNGKRVDLRGIVAKQYGGDRANNLDYSIVADYWPGIDSPQEEELDPELAKMIREIHAAIFDGAPQYGVENMNVTETFIHRTVNNIANQIGAPVASPENPLGK